jgi:TonB family protein
LDGVTIQKTVSRYTGSVKRSCWQPALDTRAKDAPSSARVSVTIHVAPGGNVSSVSSSGDPKGYRGLANCITSRVRGWQFPAAGAPTTVNVPFVFAAQ